jgi:hypothetical protein
VDEALVKKKRRNKNSAHERGTTGGGNGENVRRKGKPASGR